MDLVPQICEIHNNWISFINSDYECYGNSISLTQLGHMNVLFIHCYNHSFNNQAV